MPNCIMYFNHMIINDHVMYCVCENSYLFQLVSTCMEMASQSVRVLRRILLALQLVVELG